MEQNTHLKTLRNSVLPLTILMMVSSCSLLGTRPIEVTAKPMERKIVQPIMPREIELTTPSWIVVTPDNWEDQLARIEEQEGELKMVYENGKLIVDDSLLKIRKRIRS